MEGYPNTVAWYLDATIHYTDTSHVVLLSLALLSICAFIVPYILLLLFPKLWLRFRIINKYCKPFIDAILAPYRENQHHWFSLRLILQVEMCIVFACYQGSSYSSVATINGSILIAFSFIHCVCHPFKSRYLNILDTWLALIGCAIFAFYRFFLHQRHTKLHHVQQCYGTFGVSDFLGNIAVSFSFGKRKVRLGFVHQASYTSDSQSLFWKCNFNCTW